MRVNEFVKDLFKLSLVLFVIGVLYTAICFLIIPLDAWEEYADTVNVGAIGIGTALGVFWHKKR